MTNVGYCACNKYNPHFITTHSINNPNYIKMQQNKNQQLDAKFRKFIKVLIMRQIQNSGFITPVQESDVQHPTRPSGRSRQQRRKPEGTQPVVCHPHHSREEWQRPWSHFPKWYNNLQLTYGVVSPVQVPSPKRT